MANAEWTGWRLGGGRIVHPGWLRSVRCLSDEHTLTTDRDRAILWDANGRRVIDRAASSVSVAVSTDGTRLALTADGALSVYEAPAWTRRDQPIAQATAACFHAGALYVIADRERLLRLDADGAVDVLTLPESAAVWQLVGGRALVAVRQGAPTVLYLLDLTKERVAKRWKSTKGRQHRVQVSGGGRLVGHTAGAGWKIWDVTTREQVKPGARGHVWHWDASEDASVVATSGKQGIVRVVETQSGALLHELRGSSNQLTALALTPDGAHVAASYYVKDVRVWRLDSGEEVPFDAPVAGALCGFTTDGSAVLACGLDGDLRCHEIGGGQRFVARGIQGYDTRLSTMPSGRGVCAWSCCVRAPAVSFVDVDSGAPLGPGAGHRRQPVASALDATGNRLVTLDPEQLIVWDLSSGTKLSQADRALTIGGGSMQARDVAFGLDGALWLATAVQVLRLDPATLEPALRLVIRGRSFAFIGATKHGVHVVTDPPPRRRVRLIRLDPLTGAVVHDVALDYMGVRAVAFSDARIVTVGDIAAARGIVDAWNPMSGEVIERLVVPRPHITPLLAMAVSPTTRLAATAVLNADGEPEVTLVDVESMEVRWQRTVAAGAPSALAFDEDAALSAGFIDGRILTYDLTSDSVALREPTPGGAVTQLRYVGAGRLAVTCADYSVCVDRG